MKNLERTINGLTRHSARQLGQAYSTLAESLDLIEEIEADRSALSKEFTKLSIDASILRQENAELKRKLRGMEDGGKMPERNSRESLCSAVAANRAYIEQKLARCATEDAASSSSPPMRFDFFSTVIYEGKSATVSGTMFDGRERFYDITLPDGSRGRKRGSAVQR